MTPDETIAQQYTGKSREELDKGYAAFLRSIEEDRAQLRAIHDYDGMTNLVLKLRADLALEKERADKLSINLREVTLDYQNVCRDRNKADRDAIAYEQRAESAESRLAALQAHADGLAKAMDGALQVADRTTVEFYTARNALTAYRAFTAEGRKKP